MSLVQKIYIDSRSRAGDPSNFTARLPEPIRADPTLGIVLSQLMFVNNFNTVIEGYSDRLYFGLDLADTSGVITANINDRVCRLWRAVLVHVVRDDLRSFVRHVFSF